MDRIALQDYQVLVLADGDTHSAVNNARGHLFEKFIGQLLHEYGFREPHERNFNVTSDGIELDVVMQHAFTNQVAIVEAKAYSTNVRAHELTSFYGKLGMAQFETPEAHGYLVVLPRLASPGEEKARAAEQNNKTFHYLDAQQIVEKLRERGLIMPVNALLPDDVLISDPALVITGEGLYSCVKILNPESRLAESVFVWGRSVASPAPAPVRTLIRSSDYGADLPVIVSYAPSPELFYPSGGYSSEANVPVIFSVRGSSSDFEYQFPASPEFFVGRKSDISRLEKIIDVNRGTFILNAQSGWGKSSLALKAKMIVEKRGGYALIIDSRTATSPHFVIEALRVATQGAAEKHILELPADSSWAGLKSAISTIEHSKRQTTAPFLIFFDQFENVFQDEVTTRQFRDLTLAINELSSPVLIGFAWKTDLVGWTESHPYRLRDEIRAGSTEVIVEPMGAKDIEALLRRLVKRLKQPLANELRQRMREYSQGLPWLFKKIASHVIHEVEEHGKTQEQLVGEGLNIKSLFDADLAGLQPNEKDALYHVARYAPVTAAEITDRYDGPVIQSLLDRRLLVAVGEKLDTYWDIFRDFLNNGDVPIEDSYTIGLGPLAVGPVLANVIPAGGDLSVSDLADILSTSPRSLVNTSRTLRLLGIATYEANRVRVTPAIMEAPDRELAIRRTVARNLRRHKAYSLFMRLAERQADRVSVAIFARELPNEFPAVDAQVNTWEGYVRSFASWFNYSGLAILKGNYLHTVPDNFMATDTLLTRKQIREAEFSYLQTSPGNALVMLARLADGPMLTSSITKQQRKDLHSLLILGLAEKGLDGSFFAVEGALADRHVNLDSVREGLERIAGGAAALAALYRNPMVDNFTLGSIIRDACKAEWGKSTVDLAAKYFRGWAKAAGVAVAKAREPEESTGERLF